MHRRQVLGQRRIAEPELDGAEAAFQQFLGLVGKRVCRHQAKAAGVVGRHPARLAAEQPHQRLARRDRERIPAGDVETRHRHADDALHADQREPLGETLPQLGRRDGLALGALLDLLQQACDRDHGAREIATTDRRGR